MKVIKRINNDAVLCIDSRGNRVVALGRDLSDVRRGTELELSRVDHTFYDVDPRYVDMIGYLEPEYLDITATIADAARGLLSYELSPNIEVALADHLSFAVRRMREGIHLQTPLAFDIRQNYPLEFKIAEYALKCVRDRLRVDLPRTETAGVAMCLINNAYASGTTSDHGSLDAQQRLEATLEDVTSAVEEIMGIEVDREGFGYARFITHIQYLITRLASGESISTENSDVYRALAERSPGAATCADAIALLLMHAYGRQLTEEEKLYLILHINRICSREDDQRRDASGGASAS